MTQVAGRVGSTATETPATRLGRIRAPVGVAVARLRARPGRTILVTLGVAAATALLLASLGGSVAARDRAVQRAVAALPPADRSFRVDAFGLPDGVGYAHADAQVRRALGGLAPRAPIRLTSFRELRIRGRLVQLAAVDRLGALARLRSGRLPRSCVPARCEVVQVVRRDGPRRTVPRLDDGDIHLVPVGVAELPPGAVLGAALDPGQSAEPPALLLASGVQAFDRLPAFDGLYRVYSWVAPLDPRRLHVWSIDRVLALETRAQTTLAGFGDVYRLGGPDQALVDARAQGRVAAQRMLLVGGEGSALVLGFALVAAMGLRRGLANERRRLLQRGATRAQVWLAAVAEIGSGTLAGTLAGVGAGVAATAVVAGRTGIPAGQLLGHSAATLTGVAVVAGVWVAATVVALAATRVHDADTGHRRVKLLDVAAVGAAAAIGLGLSRGGLDPEAATSGSSRTLLLALPLLVSFVAAVLVARLLRPLTRLAERGARGGAASLRLALLALSRAPARTTATVAFLLVSLGLALFASSWRTTLDRGARDQAAFAVPLDFTAAESPRLVLPLDAAPLARYQRLGAGVTAYPVLRRSADVAGIGAAVASPAVLGVPAGALPHMRWRPDFSPASPAELARRLGADGAAPLRAVPLPQGATRVELPVRLRGVAVRIDLVVQLADGKLVQVELGERGPGPSTLRAALPAAARRVFGLELSLATAEQFGFSHRESGADEAAPEAGHAQLGALRALRADGSAAPLTGWDGFVARGGLQLEGARSLAYSFTAGQAMVLRLPQVTDARPLRVVASSSVARSAGPGGTLVLDFQDVRVRARIVGVATRFPGVDDQGEGFVVADEQRLATALDADDPGSGVPSEVWLAAPAGAHAAVASGLARPPFDTLDVTAQSDLRRSLASEPLAHGISVTLLAAALVALALAVVGFWVALLSELRDERGELFDLEAQGVAPATLRRQFRLRSLLLVAVGLATGCLLGLVLSRLVVSVVRISGTAGTPQPPLRLDVPWPLALGVAAGLVLVLAAVVELTTRRAFRGEAPARASWSLE